MKQSAGLEVVSKEKFSEFMEETHRDSPYSVRLVDYRNGDSGRQFRLNDRAIAEIRSTKACGQVWLIEKKVEVTEPSSDVVHYVTSTETGINIVTSETKMRTELFTQLFIGKESKSPMAVFLDDGTSLATAFERLAEAYSVRYKDESWLSALLYELPAYADVLAEVGESKMKTDITPELTISFYVHTVPMTRFV